MTFRIGAVGVGAWSQKLATAFRECGAEVVAHSRKSQRGIEVMSSTKDITGFGEWVKDWRELVPLTDIDALIICAPPDITTEVALACAKAGKRCVATKPLLWSDVPENCWDPPHTQHARYKLPTGHTDCYVDLWRLYSPAWLAMKEELRGKKIERVEVAFCGNGPFRSFNGALDYGPHALAFVYDLLGTTEPTEFGTCFAGHERLGSGVMYGVQLNCDRVPVNLRIGNGAKKPQRWIRADTNHGSYSWEEPKDETTQYYEPPGYAPGEATGAVACEKSYALRRFCRAFMAGEASRTLEYSIAAQRILERITQP